jgi:hypothetical protein
MTTHGKLLNIEKNRQRNERLYGERNNDIALRLISGETIAKVATDHKLSMSRVTQITIKLCRLCAPAVFKRMIEMDGYRYIRYPRIKDFRLQPDMWSAAIRRGRIPYE